MKHKQKIALLSVAAIPAVITIAPSTDVQATQETVPPTSGSWINPQHTFDAKTERNLSTFVAPTTTTVETAKDTTELENILKKNFQKYEESFSIKYIGKTAELQNDLNSIYEKFDLDTDNAIYKAATISRDYTYSGYVNNVTINFTIKYNTNANTEASVKSAIETIKKGLITENMSEFQKIKAIHDYVVTSATYTKDTTASPHAANTFLTEKKGLSQAYALVTYHLLNEAGITAYYMTGTYAGTPHAWNVVEYKGKYYYLDTALDEPSIRDTSITDGKATSYEYFLKGTVGFATHTNLSTLPIGINVEAKSDTSYADIQNVFNPITVYSWLYYVRTDSVLARLDLTPLATIGESPSEFKEILFKDDTPKNVEAAYLVHDKGWLYFSNVKDNNYLYKVKTDGTDLTLLVPTYVRDLVITGTTLEYKKSDGTKANISIAVETGAAEKVINMFFEYAGDTPPVLKKLIDTHLEYLKLIPSQKVKVDQTTSGDLDKAIKDLQSSGKENTPAGIALRIALLDVSNPDLITRVNEIKKIYDTFSDTDKLIVYNYHTHFVPIQKTLAANATAAEIVDELIGNLTPNAADYYTQVKAALNAFYALTGAQQGLVEKKPELNSARLVLQDAEKKIADGSYVYKISQLNPKAANFNELFLELKSSIEKLTDAEKTLITNINIYDAALKTHNDYTKTVKDLFTAIEKIENDTTKAALDTLLARYTALGAAEREMIDKLLISVGTVSIKPIDHLKAAIAAKFAETNTVDLVITKINNLDASNDSFVNDVKDAEIATKSFDDAGTKLTTEEQDRYDLAKEKLEIAVVLVAQIEAIITEINSIPTTTPTDEAAYKTLVNTIEDSIKTFESLEDITISGENKAIPNNLKMLGHAEKHFSNVQKLKDARTTIDNASKLITDIANISLVDPITDHATAQDIRERYEALNKIGQHFVGDITKLTDLEALHYKSAAQTVIDLITAIDITKDSFVEDVRKATEAYEKLSPQAKVIVDNGGHNVTLKNAQEKVKPLKAVVDAIYAVSEEDPKTYESKYLTAQKAFDALDDDQERFITNKDRLATFKANIDTAKAVIASIDALSKDSTEEAILAAQGKYEALSEFQKKLVTNYSKLESLIDKANGKEEAEAVIAMIAKLDETKKTFALDVKRARDAYDKLTDKQKKYVTNYEDLLAAEKKVADLVDTSDIAQKMIAQIAAINSTSASFKGDVEAAKSAYAALPEAQQALIINYNILKEHLATYDTYAAKAKQLEDQINALSSSSPGYQAALAALQNQYNTFNAAQKAFVPEYAVKLLNAAQSGNDAVRNVTNMILALNPSKPTFHADVANARAAYNTLIKNHGVYLAAYLEEALEKAEALVAKDKSAARKVEDAINALSSESILKEIERARRVYNNLTAVQRTLVKNLQILIDFETGKRSYNYSGIPSGVDTGKDDKPSKEEPTLPDYAAVPGERTAMTKSPKSNTYTAKIYVDEEIGRDARFVLTTTSNVTAIIPPTVTIVGEKTGTMVIEIKPESSKISFKATIGKKPVTFATDVQLVVESVPAKSVIYRIDNSGKRTKATYTVDGNQYTISTKKSDTFIISRSNK